MLYVAFLFQPIDFLVNARGTEGIPDTFQGDRESEVLYGGLISSYKYACMAATMAAT